MSYVHYISTCQNDLFSSKSFQIPPECTIYRPCFIYFSAVPNRFKYRQNAPCTVLVFIFSAVPNRFKYCQNECVRDIVFIICSEVTNRFKHHHNACNVLETLFSFLLSSSKTFQIPSECMLETQ